MRGVEGSDTVGRAPLSDGPAGGGPPEPDGRGAGRAAASAAVPEPRSGPSEAAAPEAGPEGVPQAAAEAGAPQVPAAPVGHAEGHPRRWHVLAVLLLCLTCVVADNTTLNVALRTLADPSSGVGASHSELEWILSAYPLALAALLLTCGALADRWGRRRVLLLGLAVYGTASVLSAHAPGPEVLIGTRAVMGMGAAAVMPVTLAVIADVFPLRERPRAIGLWAGTVGVALALGPVAGGVLLERFWWGSVFLVSLPVVAVALVAVAVVVPESRDPAAGRLDLGGAVLSALGLAALVYGVIEAGRLGSVTVVTAWLPALAGLLLCGCFAWWESRREHPAFEIRFFRRPGFSAAVGAVGFVSFAMSGFLFFSTFYMQSVRGLSPVRAGLYVLALALANVLFGPLSPLAVRRFGPRAVCAGGLLAMAATLTGLLLVRVSTPMWAVLPLFFLMGAAMAHVMPPAAVSVMTAIPKSKAASGSAMNNTVRQVGGALGVAVLGALLGARYRAGVWGELSGVPEGRRAAAAESIEATAACAERAGERGPALVAAAQESFVAAMHTTALVAAGMAVLGALVVLRWMPGRLDAADGVPNRTASQEKRQS
ncbi:MFS transporter [Allostreptomyces psammosilenae]|nr:MFS transporter [Allostreptomyces psammosilenae]